MLAIAILMGRLSGVYRELQLASIFGISKDADMAILLLSLPDLLVNLLAAGGLSAVLVPRFRELQDNGDAQLFRRAIIWVFSIFGIIGLMFFTSPQYLLHLLSPGLEINATIPKIAILCVALSIPCAAITGVTGAYLNANDRFFVAGLGTLVFNITIVIVLTFRWTFDQMAILGFAILAGSILRLLIQYFRLPNKTWKIEKSTPRETDSIITPFIIGVLSTTLVIIPPIMVRSVSSLLGDGYIATFNYAQKIIELPIGVLITTISTVILPKLSGHYTDGNKELAIKTIIFGVNISVIISFLCIIFYLSTVDKIIPILFSMSKFGIDGINHIARLSETALFSLPFISINGILSASLYARHLPSKVLKANLISTVACALFIFPGLLLENSSLLMGSVAVSQAVLSVLLAREAGHTFFGNTGFINRSLITSILVAGSLCVPIVASVRLVGAWSAIAALCLAAVGFALSVMLAARSLNVSDVGMSGK